MTKKDYVALAAALKDASPRVVDSQDREQAQWDRDVKAVA